MGSWVSYGLGSESDNLPAFVTISPSMGNGGPRNYGPAFLPALHQGTALGRAGRPASEAMPAATASANWGWALSPVPTAVPPWARG